MANILGSLLIQLGVNNAEFLEGMSKASYSAKQASREMERSFSGLSGVLSKVLAPLGDMGARISASVSQIGAFSSAAQRQLSAMGSGMSAVTLGLGAVTGGTAALAAGAVGLAFHTAETIARMQEQSQMAGVSIEAFSRLAFAAEHVGIGQDTMAMALERMSKSAVASTTAIRGLTNPYKELGISVQDATGRMKPADALFAEIAGKLGSMGDTTRRTALEMAIFGRGGAELGPLLALGMSGVMDLEKESDRLGKTISEKTGKAAEQFEQNLRTLRSESEGLANTLTARLLPAMSKVAENNSRALSESKADRAADAAAINAIGMPGNVAQRPDLVRAIMSRQGDASSLNAMIPPPALPAPQVPSNLLKRFGPSAAEQQRLADDIAAVTKKLTEQFNALQLASEQIENYRLKQEGASAADLKGIDLLRQKIEALQKQSKINAEIGSITSSAEKEAEAFGKTRLAVMMDTLEKDHATQATKQHVLALLAAQEPIKASADSIKNLGDRYSEASAAGAALSKVIREQGGAPEEMAKAMPYPAAIPPALGVPIDDKITEGIEKLTADLQDQIKTFGMTSAQIDIYRLKMAGALPEQLGGVTALNAQLKKLQEGIEPLGKVWRQFGDRLSTDLADAIVKGKSFKAVLEDMLKSLVELLAKQALFGTSKSGSAGSGLFSVLGSLVGGLFGGDGLGAGAAAASASGIPGIVGLSQLPALGIPARASGGPTTSGMPYLVGEKGPEIFIPRVSGTVIPNHLTAGLTRAMRGLAGGGIANANTSYVVGENGPEFFVPHAAASAMATGNARVGGHTSITNIDARGADAGSERRMRAAIRESEDRAVRRALATNRELQLRGAV